MTQRPNRIQGTDGIRGMVVADDDPQVAGLDPVDAFIEKALITPALAERYCHAFVEFLSHSGLLTGKGKIAVGYDPRDTKRHIVEAAIRGVTSAGATALDSGIIPTPGLGLFTVTSGADGGIMITASHNPADQNGIKLFLPGTGLKLFPNDDEELTAIVYELNEATAESKGKVEDVSESATRIFADFFEDSFNSWVGEKQDFNDIVLVADCANGALVPHIRPILGRFNFRAIDLVGVAEDGNVNDNCGAGLLEGHRRIDADFRTNAGADMRTVDLVQALFRHGRANRDDIAAGALRVCGAAFDADADRCYCLEYDPAGDEVIIFSGDEIALHQAGFIRRALGEEYNGLATFVTTVESDINVNVAAEELGYIPVSTGVGDKWLLWEAWCSQLGNLWDILEANSDDLTMLADLEHVREEFEKSPEPNARGMLLHRTAVEKVAKTEEINLLEELLNPDMISFAVGSEETGHSVTAARVKTEAGQNYIAYFGNGLKSALNWLSATENLAIKEGRDELWSSIRQPFPPGHKRTLPVYYTDKSRLQRGSEVMNNLQAALLDRLRERIGDRLTPEVRPRAEEPDMLYIALYEPARDEKEPSARAAVFIRNSGTEAKTSVYVRSDVKYAAELDTVAEEAVVLLARLMKDEANPFARAEHAVLKKIAADGPQTLGDLANLLSEVNAKRLIVEMSLKQQLLEPKGDRLALTDLGKRVTENLLD